MKIENYAPVVDVQITMSVDEFERLTEVCQCVVLSDEWHIARRDVCQSILDSAQKPTTTRYRW